MGLALAVDVFAAIGLFFVAVLVFFWAKAKIEEIRWRKSQRHQLTPADMLTKAEELLEREVLDEPSEVRRRVLQGVADYAFTVIGSESERLKYERDAFQFKVTKHQHFEWWIDFLIRCALTVGAAWFTWGWFFYIREIVSKIPATKLSDGIVIALLTTTTANILGAWAIVARYVWRIRQPEPSTQEKTLAPGTDADDKKNKIARPKLSEAEETSEETRLPTKHESPPGKEGTSETEEEPLVQITINEPHSSAEGETDSDED